MALDGIVRMVDAFFRHWDDTEKMWSEYERAGFRLVVIGGELRPSELNPIERMKYRCKHRRLVERWRDMRLEGSKFDGVALAVCGATGLPISAPTDLHLGWIKIPRCSATRRALIR
jgi:hypothetical protein